MTQYKALEALARVAAICAPALVLAACAARQPTADSRYTLEVPAQVMARPAPAASSPVMTAAEDAEGLPPVGSLDEARVLAPELGLREDAPLRYVVKPGDTLWDIANKYLADSWQWPELWYVNDKIANPHRIYPGDVLELAYLRGRPVLARGGSGLERVAPQVREVPLDAALPAIPIDTIRAFLRGPRVVDAATLNRAPYLLEFTDEHLLGSTGTGVFIQNLPPDAPTSLSVVRQGEPYRDPETRELLGYEALPTGEVDIRDIGTPAEGVLTEVSREVRRGDRLLPPEADNFQANFYPHAPAQAVDGRIISVYNGLSQISQYQIVTLNRGSEHGLEPGHILSVLQVRDAVKDPYTGKRVALPTQYSGELMIFKVAPKLSYGLVMEALRPIHLLDRVAKPDPASGR